MIAEIIIQSNVQKLNRIFDYKVPDDMQNDIKIGSRVLVPFGNTKKLKDGYIVNLKDTTDYEVKEIAKIQDDGLLDEKNIEFAKWMATEYFCNVSDCLRLMMPPGTTTKKIENRVKEKSLNFITLKKDKEEIEDIIEQGGIKSDKQIRTLRFVMENEEILVPELEMFADTSRAVINTLCKNGYLEIIEKQVERNPFEDKNIERTEKLKLNEEQQRAFDEISNTMDDMLYSEFLIFGVTGSRKNRNIFAIDRKSFK